MQFVRATEGDVDAVANTLALAFADDPVWGAALARADGSTEHLRPFWSLFVRGALSYDTVYLTPDAGAVATWIPPGGVELPGELEQQLFDLASGALAPELLTALHELWDRFEAAHPHDQPHAYLSLLATHPTQRGAGIAQLLMAANLASWDAAGIPSYLESTNPANDHRYARAGFAPVGGFEAPLTGSRITTMWRDVPAAD